MGTSNPVTITLTATAADAQRIQAAVQAAGFSSVKACIVSHLQSMVSSYEQQQQLVTYQQTSTPIAPS